MATSCPFLVPALHHAIHRRFPERACAFRRELTRSSQCCCFLWAEISGGALFHHAGKVFLSDANFTGNMAGSEGLAAVTYGELDAYTGFFAENNSFYCPLGQFAFDKPRTEVRRCTEWAFFPEEDSIWESLSHGRLFRSGRGVFFLRWFR